MKGAVVNLPNLKVPSVSFVKDMAILLYRWFSEAPVGFSALKAI
jgi:hypothetical protein